MAQRGWWEPGEIPKVLPGSRAPIHPPSNGGADPLPGTRPGCTATQCRRLPPYLRPKSRPCLTAPARPQRESRAWSNAGHAHSMGLTTGYLSQILGAGFDTLCGATSSPELSPNLLLCLVESHLHPLLLIPSVHALVTGGSQGSFPSMAPCERAGPPGSAVSMLAEGEETPSP